jgi:hypothetical protein
LKKGIIEMINQRQREITKASANFVCLILILVWAFTEPQRAQAQWSTNPNTGHMSTTNTGNVGIGTTNPQAKLEIGKDSTYNLADTAALRLSNATTPLKQLFAGYDSSLDAAFLQSTYDGQSVKPILLNAAGGNVGIGTTSPVSTFDIQLSFTNYLNLRAPSLGTGAWVRVVPQSVGSKVWQAGANQYGYSIFNETDVQYRLVIGNDGKVGIGTTAPDTRLTVVGASTSIPITYNNGEVATFIAPNDSFNAVSIARGGVTNPQGMTFGVNQASLYSEIQSSRMGITTNDLILNRQGGNVGIGKINPQAKLDVQGNVSVAGDVTATGAINAKYQDVAEWVTSRQKLAAGTVVILDPEKSNQVIASTESYDTRIAGIISEQPGVLLGEGGEGKVKVATTGRVRVKVDATRGAIKIGDLLVTSDKEGVAMKSELVNIGGIRMHRPGTLIGKALEPLESGVGEILVLLSLQ